MKPEVEIVHKEEQLKCVEAEKNLKVLFAKREECDRKYTEMMKIMNSELNEIDSEIKKKMKLLQNLKLVLSTLKFIGEQETGIIRRMLKKNMSIEEIHDLTDESIECINQIRKMMKG